MSTQTSQKTPGRNDPCPCGSGKKYKKCCGQSGASSNSRKVDGLLPQAISALESGNPLQAREICSVILTSNSSDSAALQVTGLAEYQLGNIEAALSSLEKSFSLDPGNGWVANNIASILQEADRLEEAFEYAQKATALEPRNAEAVNNLGMVFRKLGNLDAAESAFQKALELDPGNSLKLTNLGEVLLEKGELVESRNRFEAALKKQPDFVPAKNNLGVVLQKTGKLDTALEIFQGLLEQFPLDVEVLNNIGLVYVDKKEYRTALEYFQQAINTDRYYEPAYINLVGIYSDLGDRESAIKVCNLLTQAVPVSAKPHKKLAEIYKDQNKPKLAFLEIKHAEEIAPEDVGVCLAYASILERFGQFEKANDKFATANKLSQGQNEVLLRWANFCEKSHKLEQAHQLLDRINSRESSIESEKAVIRAKLFRREGKLAESQKQLDSIHNIGLLTSKIKTTYLREYANTMDKLGRFDEAFDYYQRAAAEQKIDKDLGYDAEKSKRLADDQIAFLTKDLLSGVPRVQKRSTGSGHIPIFIVGFPRSGTTLVEQILCSHKNIAAGDELTFIEELAKSAPKDLGTSKTYPFWLNDLSAHPDAQQLLYSWGNYYLDRAKEVGAPKEDAKYFTDKMPLNLVYLPLISILFPESPIIHMMRNPMDSVMSSVFAGFSRHSFWAHDFEDAAKYFVESITLAKNALANMDMKYIMVRYEDLVADQEGWSRKIIDFVGLEWDDRCLDFHKTERVSRTASYEQITKKIYTSSVARYRNYEKHLKKPLSILRPVMEEMGYL